MLAWKHASTISTVASSFPVSSCWVAPPWHPPPASAAVGSPRTTAVAAMRLRSIPRFISIPPRGPMPWLHRWGRGGSRGLRDPDGRGLGEGRLQAHRVGAVSPEEDVALDADM